MSSKFLSFFFTCTHAQKHVWQSWVGGLGPCSHRRLVPVPTRKQLIICERLSERLLSGQQQHSAIYLPWRQESQHTTQACTHPHTRGRRTKKQSQNAKFVTLKSTCKLITLMQGHEHLTANGSCILWSTCKDTDTHRFLLQSHPDRMSWWHIQRLHAPHVWH